MSIECGELQYRVEKRRKRCETFTHFKGWRVRCTRSPGHDGEHICQLSSGMIFYSWK